MSKNVIIVGLRISELKGKPQHTLLGNPMRSWALFERLGRYGFNTQLFVGAGCDIDEPIQQEFGDRLIVDSQEFIKKASENDCIVIVCGTRIHETIAQHPWVLDIRNAKIVLAQCYHNRPELLPIEFSSQIKHALFVTPRYLCAWNADYPTIPSSIMTTGQVDKEPNALESNGDAIFVGHIHNLKFLNLMAKLAENNVDKNFHVVTSRIKNSEGKYVVMKDYDEEERNDVFAALVKRIYGTACPDNLIYHFLPPGKEESLMDKVSVGIDYTWNPDWVLDNSKVPYYLTYGLNIIAHLPAPSHRFVTRFDAGVNVEQAANFNTWDKSFKQLTTLPVEHKNARRYESGKFFSWDNVAFDVAAVLLNIE
ncbi:hypothetical protein [Paraglaciecola sp. 2405UD69-4]|uniref:hypothetical protein n=1 Tax=Paraglaciecola sp. 2405UD69-4 TaxID=3391836 RepID=UPI0039C90A3D